MKVTNLKKKVGAALLAAGMITPATAFAFDNLIVNGSFEDVEAGPLGSYFTQPLNGWLDGSQVGSTYKYAQDYDRPNNFDGNDDPNDNPPSPGLRYFNANYPNHNGCRDDDVFGGDPNGGHWLCDPNHGRNAPHHVAEGGLDTNSRGQVMQDVDLTGLGGKTYQISAWFGSISGTYDDPATFELFVFDANDTPIQLISVTGNTGKNAGNWARSRNSGVLDSNAARAEASVYSTGVGHRYVDLAFFAIVPEPSTVLLAGLGILGMGFGSLRKRKS